MNIQSHIHDILSESMKEEDGSASQQRQDITERELLQVLRERGEDKRVKWVSQGE